MPGFFFLGCCLDFGTALGVSGLEVGAELEEGPGALPAGSFRRELKEAMKSIAWGESPRRLLKWDAASGLERERA